MKNIALKLLYFAPAILVTALMLRVGFESIINADGPYWIYVIVGTLWLSGVLLSCGIRYGGVVALIMPVGDYVYSLSGYSGHRHIDTLPYVLGLAVYYAVCGFLVYKNSEKSMKA